MRFLLLWSFAVSLKKKLLWIGLFSSLYTQGAGADNSNGVNFEHHRKLLSLWSSAESFRWTALNSDFTQTFHDFTPVYRLRAIPGQGQIIRRCQFQATNEALLLWSFAISFIKTAFNSWFYMDFFMILGQGQGQITPMGKFLSITGSYYHSDHLL